MEKKQMTCIVCPLGCHIEVIPPGEGVSDWVITGNKCQRGNDYGIKEMTSPTRMLTSTVKIVGANLRRLPVRTAAPIPKGLIYNVMSELNKIQVIAPVSVGQIVIPDVLGTGIDIIASRSMEKIQS